MSKLTKSEQAYIDAQVAKGEASFLRDVESGRPIRGTNLACFIAGCELDELRTWAERTTWDALINAIDLCPEPNDYSITLRRVFRLRRAADEAHNAAISAREEIALVA